MCQCAHLEARGVAALNAREQRLTGIEAREAALADLEWHLSEKQHKVS
jgi:hypothetical protein